MDIGMRVKQLREEQRLSQYDLSKLAGVQQSTISYIEIGEKNPSVDTAIKLANALGVDLNTLVGIGTIQRMSNEDMVIRIAKALDVDILVNAKEVSEVGKQAENL